MSDILYSNKNVRFYIDETVPCLVNEWDGFIPGAVFRQSIIKLLEIAKQHRPLYPKLPLLADTRTLGVISRADLDWVTNEINHLYVEVGIQHEAFVMSQDAFGNVALNRYITQTTKYGTFTVQIYPTLEEAVKWLKSI
jgi:hypothetical protein